MSCAVQEPHFSRRWSQGRIIGAAGRGGGFVEVGAKLDEVTSGVGVGLRLDIGDRVSEMAVDLAEYFSSPRLRVIVRLAAENPRSSAR